MYISTLDLKKNSQVVLHVYWNLSLTSSWFFRAVPSFVYKDVQFPNFVFHSHICFDTHPSHPNRIESFVLNLTDSYRCQNCQNTVTSWQQIFHWQWKVSELIWFPRFGSKSLEIQYRILDSDGVFCVSDGWSNSDRYTYESADVYVQAWKFSISDILFTQTDTRGSGIISVSSTITLPQPFNIDNHIYLVQVK